MSSREDPPEPIDFEEALASIVRLVRPASPVELSLRLSDKAVLAEAVNADHDSPKSDNSRVDGWAVRFEDLLSATKSSAVTLTRAGESRAGSQPDFQPNVPKSCVRISTGAAIPSGFNAVVMQEVAHETDGGVSFAQPARLGANIRRAAEDFAKGQTLAEAGTVLDPGWISLLASAGVTSVQVRQPRVSLVITGDEVGGKGEQSLSDANGPGLSALIAGLNAAVGDVRYAGDTFEATKDTIAKSLEGVDLAVVTGGISVGPHDHVRAVMDALGFETAFWRSRVKPGFPTCLGVHPTTGKCLLALPGNPVSAMTMMIVYGIPVLNRLAVPGWTTDANQFTVPAILDEDLHPSGGRREFVRAVATVRPDGLHASSLTARASHLLTGFAGANALIHLPENASTFSAGATVPIQLIPGAAKSLL